MLATSNRINDLINAVVQSLIPLYDDREARAIIYALFEERFEVNRVKLALNPDLRLSESEIVQVHKDLKKLKAGMPLQYVTGFADFAGLRLKVTPDVLIPRPETEELVQLAVSLPKQKDPEFIMDLGTGSGAIALALKMIWQNANVFATDTSLDALQIAEENGRSHNLYVNYIQHDMLSHTWPINKMVDLLLSNPPYIPASECNSMHPNVKHFEPKMALFVDDDDPLKYYSHIGNLGCEHLADQGWLIVEIHHLYGTQVAEIYKVLGCYKEIKIHCDIHGKHRFVSARKADCEKNDNFHR